MPIKNIEKGFTLLEVIIYTALFSFLIGSAFVTGYQLIDGSGKLSAKNTIQDEGNFMMRKISWALTGVDPAFPTVPSSGNSPTLTVTKYEGNKVEIRLDGEKIEMKQSAYGGTFRPITTDNVVV